MRVHGSSVFVLFSFLRIQLVVGLSRMVDDAYTYSNNTPDGIQYSRGWNYSTSHLQQYGNTLHYSSTPGSDLIYFFQGNAVHYIGDQNAHASIALWIDGHLVQINASETKTELQHPLWSKTDLGPGDHQLVVRHEGVHGSSIALDFLRIDYEQYYVPLISGPAASIVPSDALLVDDSRTDLIQYTPSPSWNCTILAGVPFNNTLRSTTQTGATITFRFNGTAVWYFSDTSVNHGKMHIVLDDMVGTTITGFSTRHLNQRLLWSATDLVDGGHTVMITHLDTDDKLMALDFFRYVPSHPVVTPSTHTITSTVVIPESPTASTTALNNEPVTSPDPLVKAVVGGALGGLVIFASLFAFLHTRSRRFGSSGLESFEDYKPDYNVSPYGYASPYIVVEASSSAVFSEPSIAEDNRPLMSSFSYLTLPDSARHSTIPTIGSPVLAHPVRSRSPSISSDIFVGSMPPAYR